MVLNRFKKVKKRSKKVKGGIDPPMFRRVLKKVARVALWTLQLLFCGWDGRRSEGVLWVPRLLELAPSPTPAPRCLQVVVQPAKRSRVACSDPDRAWRKTHAKFRAEHGLEASSAMWSDEGHECSGVTSERVLDAVNLCYEVARKTQTRESALDILLDVSQSICRKPYGTCIRALTTSSSFWSFTMIPPSCHMSIMGLPFVDISGQTAHSLRDLSGEAMAAPCATLALLCAACAFEDLWEGGLEPTLP